GIDVKHGKVELTVVFLAFLSSASEDPVARDYYRALGEAAKNAKSELELPESSSASVTDTSPITVSLDQTGQLSLNGERIALDQLRTAIEPLLKQDAESAITLKTDARTEVQPLLKVMDEIRAAGGRNVALATTQK
ncbi:MAG: ExbD/TolR family protein, partial [Pirellulales bacterium]